MSAAQFVFDCEDLRREIFDFVPNPVLVVCSTCRRRCLEYSALTVQMIKVAEYYINGSRVECETCRWRR